MFRIKICGITNVDDAVAAVDAGADAIGLNFYEQSPRFVNSQQAAQIATSTLMVMCGGSHTSCMGVFVNSPLERIRTICSLGFLNGVQLHGDESPEICNSVSKFRPFPQAAWAVVRVRPFANGGTKALAEDLEACQRAGRRPDALLVDAMAPGRYGGTGETVPWNSLTDHRRWLGDTPLILAGGLTPDNVAEAIRIVRPAAVDVASGVESAPGKKDPHKVRDFVAAAEAAFDAIGPSG